MVVRSEFATIAALMGDPTRARILEALMDGRARTATELSLEGGVSPSTASSHLSRLTAAGLLSIAKQGRHRYFRVASRDVAATIEQLMRLSSRDGRRSTRTGPADEGLRRARVCYDHLAGEVAVRLLDRLREGKLVGGRDAEPALTTRGESWCERIGIDLEELKARRRPLCVACLDWSERRFHLGGALGAALLERLFVRRHAKRELVGRVVTLSLRGEGFLEHPDVAR